MMNHDRTGDEPRFTALTIVEGSDHIPEVPLEPLIASGLESAETETRGLRRDGWTPERKRLFQETLAECGTVSKACRIVGMSAQSAYNLRNRDPLFGAGWDTALLLARQHLADEIMARCMNGVIEQVYRNGEVVAERYRYDNRLSIAMLNRLDARADRAERLGAGQHALAARWADYLDALGADKPDDARALLDPDAEKKAARKAREHQVHQLPLEEPEEIDHHIVWQKDDGVWWTDYPPPPDFDGDEDGSYDDGDYARTLTPAEAAVMDAREAEEEAEMAEDEEAQAARQRDIFFGFAGEEEEDLPEDEVEDKRPSSAISPTSVIPACSVSPPSSVIPAQAGIQPRVAQDSQSVWTPACAGATGEAMHIRPYAPADASALATLYARSVRHFGPRAYAPEQVDAWAAPPCPDRMAARCADGRTVLVAEGPDGTLLGYGDMEPDGHLDFLYTAPEGEGRGVGSALLAALEEVARAQGSARIFVEASELARPLFERRGFTLLRRNHFAIGGVPIHNDSMEKRLT
ncbi:GNAT family N-acetyltransferase [Allosphingosinicella flava]|uniref:GNAT family N-acetyltransferase n=1 Tax=Allosphingosinicella flava TaxID=2771430 RepID=A0A7T2GI23_9SPHN|nr:GNAT family N-acetyltransferase [Sphingosinicella flava]QPQ54267.1 GNAT family N-acetyltransferase [Sphingosinicella flava]